MFDTCALMDIRTSQPTDRSRRHHVLETRLERVRNTHLALAIRKQQAWV